MSKHKKNKKHNSGKSGSVEIIDHVATAKPDNFTQEHMQHLAAPKSFNPTLGDDGQFKQGHYLQYDLKTVFRTRQDIASWNAALALAQYVIPRNFMLQLLYNEIEYDALLTSQIQNRKNQVFSLEFTLKKPDGTVDDVQTAMLAKHPMYRFLTHESLNSIFNGYSLVELSMTKTVDGKPLLIGDSIPRTNVVPQTGLFYPDYFNDVTSIAYREMPEFGTWILEFNSKTLGLLNKAVSHVLFKRFAQSCWSELCEIYGIPPRVMKTNTQDPVMLTRAQKMMKDMGAASWFIIDETEEFEWAQGVNTNGDVYSNLMDACRDEICLLIVGAIIGQDTKNGGRSKDEAAQEMLWLLVQSDMAMLEEHWNNIIIPALKKHGILTGELTFAYLPTEDIKQLWAMTIAALQFFKVDPKWIKDRFGIEITGEREQMIKANAGVTDPADLLFNPKSFFGKGRRLLKSA